jgi:hypothetical protein
MRLRIDPLSEPYVEYLLRIGNGQESSIIDHFPLKVDADLSIQVEIALYPKIHQAVSLNTFIHTIFLALVINYANQGQMDGRANFDNKKYSCEFFQHLNCRSYARARTHIFVGRLGGNGGRPGYGDWHGISQHHYFGRYATTLPGLQSWRPCHLTEKSRCGLETL